MDCRYKDASHGAREPYSVVKLIAEVKEKGRPLYVSAPMVRYSKLPFRLLVQDYNVDLTYTPMILAHEFIRHPIARDAEFSTHATEGPVVAQFASNDPLEFARAALLVAPWVDGVDLNCGCPQSWAIQEGIGCGLMNDAPKVAALVRAAKGILPPNKSVSVKIRLHKDLNQTIDFIRALQEAGVDFITVHARTRKQRSSTPPDLQSLKFVKSHFPHLPMLANGDVYTLADAGRIAAQTGVEGVMAARGLLENPTLFAGHESTPQEAVESFMVYSVRSGLRFELILHHLGEMMSKTTTRKERTGMMECKDLVDLSDWLDKQWKFRRPASIDTDVSADKQQS